MASTMYYSTPVGSRNSLMMMRLRREGNGIVEYAYWNALREMAFEAGGMLDLSDGACRAIVSEQLELKGKRLDDFCGRLARLGEIDGQLWSQLSHVVFPSVADELEFLRRPTTRKTPKAKTA